MRRTVLLLCFCLIGLAPAVASAQQAGGETCRPGEDEAARKLLRQTLNQDRPATAGAPSARIPTRNSARDTTAGVSGDSIRIVVTREAADPAWKEIRVSAAARTREHVLPAAPGRNREVEGGNDLCRFRFAGVWAQIVAFDTERATIEVNYPDRSGFSLREDWTLVVGLQRADTGEVFGYAATEVKIGSTLWSVVLGLALVMLVYGLLVAVSLQVNRRRLGRAAEAAFGREPPPPGWHLRTALNPLFLTQDASGIGSLARLQLLVFTLSVAFVYSYVLVRTGELAALSPDVLKLLGITVAGSGLARLTGETGSVSAPNRIWLKGKGLLISDDARLPKLSDLVCADGEVEIARVQAIVFSGLTVAALLVTGPRDLGGLAISNEMLILLGISQLTYVAGKAIPGESVRRLNQELNAARAAERQINATVARRAALAAEAAPESATQRAADLARTTEEAAAARAAWEAALTAAEDSLLDVYGEMLDLERLGRLRQAAVPA